MTLPDPPNAPDLWLLLPDNDDVSVMKRLFQIHVSHIIVEHIPFMKSAFGDIVEWHIQHKYYTEMGKKSEIVSFGISIYPFWVLFSMYYTIGATGHTS